jgi:tetratricopeptide (TPR) repeat protein
MSFFGNWNRWLLAAALVAAAGGCSPLDSNPLDEEKEPHYVLGKSRVNAMDYDGAIRAFEESLETNPHSAQAHYQLAMLYENQESDPAAAVYHYQQYLKYDPKADNGAVILQHIASCKQQLAADVLQLPSAPAAQQQLEKLTEENRRLHEQLAQWQAFFTNQQAAARANPPASQNPTPALTNYSSPALPASPAPDLVRTQPLVAATSIPSTGPRAPGIANPPGATPARVSQPRTHSVVRGETLASIARKQGVSLAALEAANPSVNPKKLRAGQVLTLPAQ